MKQRIIMIIWGVTRTTVHEKDILSVGEDCRPIARNPFCSKSILSQNPVAQNPQNRQDNKIKEIMSNGILSRLDFVQRDFEIELYIPYCDNKSITNKILQGFIEL